MDIKKDLKNSLFKRREIEAILESEKIPSYEEAKSIIEKEFKADKEQIVIKNVKGKFGRKAFLIKAKIYDTKEDKEKIEPKQVKKEDKEKPEEKK